MVVEVDGVNLQPPVADSIHWHIFAGQRYSFILDVNQTVDYWIHAQPNVGTTTFISGLNSTILHYDGASVADPTITSAVSHPMLKLVLVHLGTDLTEAVLSSRSPLRWISHSILPASP
jgi:hypothetical protein